MEGPFRSSAPAPETPRRHVPALVIAQLRFGGRASEIGLAIVLAAAAAFWIVVPGLRWPGEQGPDVGGLLVTSFFAVIGLGLVVGNALVAGREIALLRRGTLVPGRVIDVRVATRAPRQHEYTKWFATFEFERRPGDPYRCRVAASTQPALGDAGTIVYDPRWPDHATSLDHLPGAPAIDATGRVRLREGRPHAAALAVAALAMVVADVLRLIL